MLSFQIVWCFAYPFYSELFPIIFIKNLNFTDLLNQVSLRIISLTCTIYRVPLFQQLLSKNIVHLSILRYIRWLICLRNISSKVFIEKTDLKPGSHRLTISNGLIYLIQLLMSWWKLVYLALIGIVSEVRFIFRGRHFINYS